MEAPPASSAPPAPMAPPRTSPLRPAPALAKAAPGARLAPPPPPARALAPRATTAPRAPPPPRKSIAARATTAPAGRQSATLASPARPLRGCTRQTLALACHAPRAVTRWGRPRRRALAAGRGITGRWAPRGPGSAQRARRGAGAPQQLRVRARCAPRGHSMVARGQHRSPLAQRVGPARTRAPRQGKPPAQAALQARIATRPVLLRQPTAYSARLEAIAMGGRQAARSATWGPGAVRSAARRAHCAPRGLRTMQWAPPPVGHAGLALWESFHLAGMQRVQCAQRGNIMNFRRRGAACPALRGGATL